MDTRTARLLRLAEWRVRTDRPIPLDLAASLLAHGIIVGETS